MRTHLLNLVVLMTSAAAIASTPVKFSGTMLNETNGTKKCEIYSHEKMTQTPQQRSSMIPMTASEGETIEVTFTINYDEESLLPDGLYIIRTDTEDLQFVKIDLYIEDYDWENDEMICEYVHQTSIQLPEGEYTIAGIFVDEYTPWISSIDNLKIEEATNLTINASDATEESRFIPVSHSGVNFNEAAASQDKEAVYDAYLVLALEGSLITSVPNGYINPVVKFSPGCKMTAYYTGFYSDGNGKDYIALGPVNTSIQELKLEADDYSKIHTERTSTIFRPAEESYNPEFKYFNSLGYKYGMPNPCLTLPSTIIIDYSRDDKYGNANDYHIANKATDNNFSVAAIADMPEYWMSMMDSPYGFFCNMFGIAAPILTQNEGEIYGAWRPLGNVGIDPFTGVDMAFTSEIIGGRYPSYPEINKSFAPRFDNNSSILFGNNTPIVQMSTPLPTSFSINYIGRYQEMFNVDNPASDISVLLDEKEIVTKHDLSGCADISKIGPTISSNPGKVKVNLSCSNHLIDNIIPATTQMTMNWDAAGEQTPPALQMLQFRDNNDNVTDRFEKPEDGMMNIAAGCFYMDMDTDEYGCRLPDEVHVEIAPYNTEDFVEIEVTEVPEKYFMPAYGGFYTASLNAVKGKSENGWWTVRITLRENDSEQVQTIAPAFYISSTTAVKEVKEVDTIRINGNSIEAPAGSLFYDSFGRICQNNNLEKGIYFVRTGSSVVKVMIK